MEGAQSAQDRTGNLHIALDYRAFTVLIFVWCKSAPTERNIQMTDVFDAYRLLLIACRDANKAIIATDEPRAQKLISNIIKSHAVVVREIAAIDRLNKVKSTGAKK